MRLSQLIYTTTCNHLRRLNLFSSRSTDERIIRGEILSTRLFLILYLISIVILITYTSVSVRLNNETVNKPSLSLYQQLQKAYPDTLQCACEKISIENRKFTRADPSFHQVCSSRFVSQSWIDFTFDINRTSIWPIDVRNSLSSMWRLIDSLCRISMSNVMRALEQFTLSPSISGELLSESLLKAKIEADLDLLQSITAGNLMRPLIQLLRLIQANELITGLSLNYIAVTEYFGRQSDSSHVNDISTYVGIVGNVYQVNGTKIPCSCKNNRSCPLPGNIYSGQAFEKYGIYDLETMNVSFTVPGLVIDCIPLRIVLESSLECFYDQNCLNNILLAYSRPLNISILDSSLPSRYSPNAKLEKLISNLFLEQIVNETRYSDYYLECSPVYCSYMYAIRFDWIYVINTLLALVGGLNAALRLTTPTLVNLFLFGRHRFLSRNNRVTSLPAVQSRSMRSHMKDVFYKLKKIIVEVNIFTKTSHQPYRIRNGRIATRLYLLFMVLSLGVLIFYTTFLVQISSYRLASPTKEQYQVLFDNHGDKLICPCTTISIQYGEFIELSPTFHQLCSSDFIQPWWYQSLSPWNHSDTRADFIGVASSYFQILSTFCEIVNSTIVDALRQFYSIDFVNTNLLSRDDFYLQIQTIIPAFLHNTKTDFQYMMSVIQSILQANQYISSAGMNTQIYRWYIPQLEDSLLGPLRVVTIPTGTRGADGEWCFCIFSPTCNFDDMILFGGRPVNIFSQLPGLHLDCSVMQAALKSSLVCWYDQSCINEFLRITAQEGIQANAEINPLNPSLSSRYTSNTSIVTMYNEMMVEEWNAHDYYEKFYEKCQPLYCSYTYQEQTTVIYVITAVIGLCGGLNIVFRLISPFLVSAIISCTPKKRSSESTQSSPNQEEESCCTIQLRNIEAKMISLNLFDTESNDERIIKYERWSTRLYLFLLIFIIFSLTLYHGFMTKLTTVYIENATQYDYEQLLLSYSKSLQCPCTHYVIPYHRFISINSSFHQVCSTEFVGDLWQKYLFVEYSWRKQDRIDLRGRGASYFNLLSTTCRLAQTTIKRASDELLADTLITGQVIPEYEFKIRINTLLDQFKRSTNEKFANTFKMVHEISERNGLVSSFFLNWVWYLEHNSTVATIPIQPIVMNNQCSCGTRNDCVQPGGFTLPYSSTLEFAVPGWKIGCSVLDTLFHSTLECFYNQTCVDLTLHYAIDYLLDPGEHFYQYVNASAMHSAIESRFTPSTVVGDMVNELFLEQWHINVSYSSYFDECSVAFCSFVVPIYESVPSIISQILGLYGGLTVTLRFFIPNLIKILLLLKTRFARNTIFIK